MTSQIDDTPCQTFMNRMRVCLPERHYYYPDVVVTCGERFYEVRQDCQTLLNPLVVVEVSSDETEIYDQTRKREVYQRILSLRDYLIVAPDHVYVTHYTRTADEWSSRDYTEITDEIVLASIECKLPLARVYKKVTWT